jgi:hypothetical protein
MGPLIVAMPRTKYQGAFSSVADASSSKLISSDNEEEETIARQMGCRLSQKLGVPVFVSCSFARAPAMAIDGVDQTMIQHKAAALAERKISLLLRNYF